MNYYESVAKVAYEASRAYAKCMGGPESLGWDLLPFHEKDTIIKSVKFFHVNPMPIPDHDRTKEQGEISLRIFSSVVEAMKPVD